MSLEKECLDACKSECCYLVNGVGPIIEENGEIEPSEIKFLKELSLEEFDSKYREKIKEILECNLFIGTTNNSLLPKKYLRGDKSKKGIAGMNLIKYPCMFLDSDKSGKPPCMIHPFKFEICKNSTIENCLYGVDI